MLRKLSDYFLKNFPFTKLSLGTYGERVADKFLRQKGLHFITRNYHCRFGEIDLIMRDEDIIVFVEVRLRSRADYGVAVESVTWKKQCKIKRSASHFLQSRNWSESKQCRFDVVSIQKANTNQWSTTWIPNAFGE